MRAVVLSCHLSFLGRWGVPHAPFKRQEGQRAQRAGRRASQQPHASRGPRQMRTPASAAPPALQVDRVARMYPGRACMSPLLDLLITMLHWGAQGWRQALAARERLFLYARKRLAEFARQHGERVLHTPGNPISLALTLASFDQAAAASSAGSAMDGGAAQSAEQRGGQGGQQEHANCQPAEQQHAAAGRQGSGSAGGPEVAPRGPGVTFLGSMLFNRCVSGTRVVARGKRQEVGGLTFAGYGAHTDAYPCDYLTVAAALGTTETDVDEFLLRLARVFAEFSQQRAKVERAAAVRSNDGARDAAGTDLSTAAA